MAELENISAEQFIELALRNQGKIENKIITGPVQIDGKNEAITSLSLENCQFKASLIIENLTIHQTFTAVDCQFKLFRFNKSKAYEVSFLRSSFNHVMAWFVDLDVDNISFKDCDSYVPMSIENSRIRRITFSSAEHNISEFTSIDIRSNCEIDELIFNEIMVHDELKFISVPNNLLIGYGRYNSIRFQISSRIKNLNISSELRGPNKLEIIPSEIGQLQMNYLVFEGETTINDCIFKEIHLAHSRATSAGTVTINSTTISEQFDIESTVLDGIQFNDCNFTSCSIFAHNASLIRAWYSNILWPKDYTIYTKYFGDNLEAKKSMLQTLTFQRSRREIYRQLKKASLDQGNTIDALAFYRNEMDAYKRQVKHSREIDIWDRIIISFNGWASNFGQSWIRPLRLLFGVHLVLFLLMLMTNEVDGVRLSFEKANLNGSQVAMSRYFEMIFPTRDIPNGHSPFYLIIDILMRVSVGFFIYHIIRATRRYAR